MELSRSDALELMYSYVSSIALRRHMLAVEAAMVAYARKLEQDSLSWGIIGLLHDFDYERWPSAPDHPLEGSKILAELGYPDEIRYAILSHADYLNQYPRIHLVDRVLFACDELCGFLVACALVRPERLHNMEAKSVKKKLKNLSFAAAVNRDDIERGAADLGIPLDQHIDFCIQAIREISDQLFD